MIIINGLEVIQVKVTFPPKYVIATLGVNTGSEPTQNLIDKKH